ncbi:ABC transporter permease [Virgibacillus sp. AGTR]|uniref:ABC transporter permease n=1 Tax=Virgibacillus sp. AGTR TaxID=2812055 RepID=UPI001964E77F|nr:ABC transporter permease [Virgibacillus sp. AGTR]MCC2250334.1 ABC transporter permease [Virgibacillus sp. AGTR]QRZ17647.1 ABC transporter permease [Virgibacillus sp. AGTR]
MHFIRIVLLFSKNNVIQLQRKWLSLPLLLLLPFIIVGLILWIIITFFTPDEANPIRVGLVDLDRSKETKMIADLLDDTSQLSSYIQLNTMEEQVAKKKIQNNLLSTYIVFPNDFTNDLYQGHSVELPIIGNPHQPAQSQMIKEFVESVTRHIRASQANVLTINHYAKELGMDDEKRNDFIFEQFKEFVFYTIGRTRIIDKNEITNQATANPVSYYAMAGWFVIITLWLLIIYNFLYKKDTNTLKQRMKLYGVHELQQIIAKIFITLFLTFILAMMLFFIIQSFMNWEIVLSDAIRIGSITGLYCFAFLLGIAILEVMVPSQRLQLLVYSLYTGIFLLLSGAIIPVIYLPFRLQELLAYIFSSETFYWLQEIILNGRSYSDFIPLGGMVLTSLFILLVISNVKERIFK